MMDGCLYLSIQDGSLQLNVVGVGEAVQPVGGEEGEDARLLAHRHTVLLNHLTFDRGGASVAIL